MKKYLIFLVPALVSFAVSCDRPENQPKVNNKEKNYVGLQEQPIIQNYQTNSGFRYETDNDRNLTQKIRQALANDNILSNAARKIQITIWDGHVTLEGIVNSDRERAMIANKVRLTNGVNSIDNRLQVASTRGSWRNQ